MGGYRPRLGSTEGLWGCTCERGSRLLVTSLFNRVQPLIPLELSDVMAADRHPSTAIRPRAGARSCAQRRSRAAPTRVAERLAAAGVARPDVVPEARAQMVVADRRAVTSAGVGAL